MTSFNVRSPGVHGTWQICANKTCGLSFFPTADIRQKYCCKPCAKAEESRRKNQRQAVDGNRMAHPRPRVILFSPPIPEETMVMILDEFKNRPEEDLIAALEELQRLEEKIRSLRSKVVEKHDIRFSELTDFMNQYKINKLNRR